MIDFRYHLVSIVSIFLALAVGIVLGAGPLQSNIGSTLGDQVVALRAEKEDLRKGLDASQKQISAGEEYASTVAPIVVGGRLTGRRVALVVLPNAGRDLVQKTRETMGLSGAKVTDTLTLTEDWFDPTKQQARAAAARDAATALGIASVATGDDLLREVLGKVASSIQPSAPSASRTGALQVLADAGLLDAATTEIVPADVVVIVSGDFAGSETVVKEREASVRALATALHGTSAATVVAGAAPVTAAGQPASSDAVAAVRGDRQTRDRVSTVDHAGEGMGPAVVVLAIAAQLKQHIGHYGLSDGASDVVPPVAP